MSEVRYRLVANYGYGDKTWLDRDLHEEDALTSLAAARGWESIPSMDSATDTVYNYYIERDDPTEVEDWDWMDS